MVRTEKTQKEKLRERLDRRFYRAYDQRKNLANEANDLENLVYEAAKQTLREKNKIFSGLIEEDNTDPELVKHYARDAFHEIEGIRALFDKIIPYGDKQSDIAKQCQKLIDHFENIYWTALYGEQTPLSSITKLFDK